MSHVHRSVCTEKALKRRRVTEPCFQSVSQFSKYIYIYIRSTIHSTKVSMFSFTPWLAGGICQQVFCVPHSFVSGFRIIVVSYHSAIYIYIKRSSKSQMSSDLSLHSLPSIQLPLSRSLSSRCPATDSPTARLVQPVAAAMEMLWCSRLTPSFCLWSYRGSTYPLLQPLAYARCAIQCSALAIIKPCISWMCGCERMSRRLVGKERIRKVREYIIHRVFHKYTVYVSARIPIMSNVHLTFFVQRPKKRYSKKVIYIYIYICFVCV